MSWLDPTHQGRIPMRREFTVSVLVLCVIAAITYCFVTPDAAFWNGLAECGSALVAGALIVNIVAVPCMIALSTLPKSNEIADCIRLTLVLTAIIGVDCYVSGLALLSFVGNCPSCH